MFSSDEPILGQALALLAIIVVVVGGISFVGKAYIENTASLPTNVDHTCPAGASLHVEEIESKYFYEGSRNSVLATCQWDRDQPFGIQRVYNQRTKQVLFEACYDSDGHQTQPAVYYTHTADTRRFFPKGEACGGQLVEDWPQAGQRSVFQVACD
jgi:hypothetical protein